MSLSEIFIGDPSFQLASAADRQSGLLAWISFVLNGAIIVDGVTLRRTSEGRLTLSFPERRDRSGKAHAIVQPLYAAARSDIERQVLAALPWELRERLR